MSSTALRRVTKVGFPRFVVADLWRPDWRTSTLQELGDIQKQPIPNVTVTTQEDDLTQWEVLMTGPVSADAVTRWSQ